MASRFDGLYYFMSEGLDATGMAVSAVRGAQSSCVLGCFVALSKSCCCRLQPLSLLQRIYVALDVCTHMYD